MHYLSFLRQIVFRSFYSATFNILVIICFSLQVEAQKIVTLQVNTKGTETFSMPVQTNLDAITFLHDSSLQLVERLGNKTVTVDYQVEANGSRILHWLVTPSTNKLRSYEIVPKKSAEKLNAMQATSGNGELVLSDGARKFLQYNFRTVYPPAGIDTAYKRSGFIHPLYTPDGLELSRINSPDHYHHWGLWNPWTHVLFEGDTVDFWNLRDRKGTVRFAGFTAIEQGPAYTGFSALHEHVAFKKGGGEKTAINELQTVRIYHPGDAKNYYLMDITVQLSCASASPVKLLEYRYGGLGIRATETWNKDNSATLTSEGKNRKDADGSTARWVMHQGDLGNSATGGLQIMSYPANYNHPEPLRVWPENMNRRGDVFLNFSPTKNKDWLLEPGKTYLLKYRFLVFSGKVSEAGAEEAWQSFANPPAVIIKSNHK